MASSSEGTGIDETSVSGIDGASGTLTYRGYRIEEVVRRLPYESVVGLLLTGEVPGAPAEAETRHELATRRRVPPTTERLLRALPPSTPVVDGMRTLLGAMPDLGGPDPPSRAQFLDLIARAPVVVARLHRRARRRPAVPPAADLGFAASYLAMLQGDVPTLERARALERYLVLLADHGISASTFALRVVLSTRSDLASAVAAALGALKGPLHGGAPSEVLDLLDEVGSPDRADAGVRSVLERGDRLFGFGHPVYRVEDPRATLLRGFAREVAAPDRFELAERVEVAALRALRERRPGRPLHTNVDYYGAVLLEAVGIPRELFTPTFAVARMPGWAAHAREVVELRRLVRPPERYVGPAPRPLPPGPERTA